MVAAVFILSVSLFDLVMLLFPVWVTAVSIYVLATGARVKITRAT